MDGQEHWRRWLARDPAVEDVAMALALIARGGDAAVLPGLAAATGGVFTALLFGGDDLDRSGVLEPLAALVDRGAELDDLGQVARVAGIAAGATLIRACGGDADPAAQIDRRIGPLLNGELSAKDTTSLALACAAHGLDDRVDRLVGSGDDFGRGRGLDAQGFARAVVAAGRAGADARVLAPAFTSFAIDFPARREAGGLESTDLLFAGFGLFGRLAGQPAKVVDQIAAFVRAIAAG